MTHVYDLESKFWFGFVPWVSFSLMEIGVVSMAVSLFFCMSNQCGWAKDGVIFLPRHLCFNVA